MSALYRIYSFFFYYVPRNTKTSGVGARSLEMQYNQLLSHNINTFHSCCEWQTTYFTERRARQKRSSLRHGHCFLTVPIQTSRQCQCGAKRVRSYCVWVPNTNRSTTSRRQSLHLPRARVKNEITGQNTASSHVCGYGDRIVVIELKRV